MKIANDAVSFRIGYTGCFTTRACPITTLYCVTLFLHLTSHITFSYFCKWELTKIMIDPYRDCTRTLKTQTAPSLSPSYGFGWIIHALCCFGIWGVSGELQSNGDESISQSHIYWEICWLSLSVHHTAVSALPTPPKHKYGSFDRPNTTLSFSCYPHRVLVHSLSRGDEVSCLLMKMGTDSA